LDCKGESCKAVIEEAPQIIDWLSEKSKNYFVKVLEYLDEMEVPYVLKPTLVRGLDYYTETVYEILHGRKAKRVHKMLWVVEEDTTC